jgi:glycosyltransferase involved in cell wall biosynthesis
MGIRRQKAVGVSGSLRCEGVGLRTVITVRTSICIVSHNGYGAITAAQKGFIGGVEWQTSLLARWLANRGHEVSFLTWDEGGPAEETINGIRIIKICRERAGLPGIRFFHPKWSGLISALRKADAEVYYHNCGECVTGQVALWCRRQGRAFVFTAANDTDCNPKLPEFKYFKDRVLYRMGLRRADQIVVQTATQREMLQSGFGLKSTVIPMPCQRPPDAPTHARLMPPSNRVLWLARVCPQKRPDRLVDLAKCCPEFEFDMVGPHYQDPLSCKAVEDAKSLANVTVHGPLPRDKVQILLSNAACLLSTSDYEGFPNTFLEAWSFGVPIISTFDPDQVIVRYRLGAIAPDIQGLAAALRTMLGDPGAYRNVSENSLAYFESHHALEEVQPRFERIFIEAASQHRKLRIGRA